MLDLRPLTDTIGTEVCGIDLTEPISAADFDRIMRAWLTPPFCCFATSR